jgi:hypothetical protein
VASIIGDSVATFNRTLFDANTADYGGAIAVISSQLTCDSCTGEKNKAHSDGGMAYFVQVDTEGTGRVKGFINSKLCDNTATVNGGAVAMVLSTVVFETTSIENSVAMERSGGAIALTKGKLFLDRVSISNSTSASHGGGIYINYGYFVMTESSITTSASENGDGGCIYVFSSTAFMDNSIVTYCKGLHGGAVKVISSSFASSLNVFSHSQAISGGAFDVSASDITESKSVLSGNTGVESGGSMHFAAMSSFSSSETRFYENSVMAGPGGAIYFVDCAKFYVHDGKFINNTANASNEVYGDGGAVYFANSFEGVITKSIFTNNIANGGSGGGVFFFSE